MRRCYKCGCKKYDDAILCKECAYKLEQKLKKKKDEKRRSDDAEQIDYHDDFETALRKIHDYEERQTD